MSDTKIRYDSIVELVQSVGDDFMIAAAARVSTGNDLKDRPTDGGVPEQLEKDAGLINYLMANKHGSPFEHGSMTFRIETPIFVVREFHRHRIGWSYNEMSGRYTELKPNFYIPGTERPLVQEGSSAHPKLVPGDEKQYDVMSNRLEYSYEVSWAQYQDLLANGVAKEVARMCLPVGIFTEFYATANPRSIMHFLELRLAQNAQYEIRMVARQIETLFAEAWPATHAAFVKNGYVAP